MEGDDAEAVEGGPAVRDGEAGGGAVSGSDAGTGGSAGCGVVVCGVADPCNGGFSSAV